MYNPFTMQMPQPFTDLSAHTCNLRFTHTVRRHHVCQTASLHVLHHHPQVALPEVRIFKVYNVWMNWFAHDEDFVDDEILFRLFFEIHLFDRDGERLTVNRSVHTTWSSVFFSSQPSAHIILKKVTLDVPLTNFSEILVHQIRVSGGTYHPQLSYHFFISLLLLFPPTRSGRLLLSRRLVSW